MEKYFIFLGKLISYVNSTSIDTFLGVASLKPVVTGFARSFSVVTSEIPSKRSAGSWIYFNLDQFARGIV